MVEVRDLRLGVFQLLKDSGGHSRIDGLWSFGPDIRHAYDNGWEVRWGGGLVVLVVGAGTDSGGG